MPIQYHCYITGFSAEVDRNYLKSAFKEFGNIQKIYIDSSREFAKVYFHQIASCEEAVQHFIKNPLGWRVYLAGDQPRLENNIPNNTGQQKAENSNMYKNDYRGNDRDLYYVNVHGDPVDVGLDEEDNMHVNMDDLTKTGFSLFLRSEYKRLSEAARNNIIVKEFELFLLSQATRYLLDNHITCIQDQQILKTIEKCKQQLLGNTPGPSFQNDRRSNNPNFSMTVNNRNRSKSRNRLSSHGIQNSETSAPMRPPQSNWNASSNNSTQQGFNRNNRDNRYDKNQRDNGYQNSNKNDMRSRNQNRDSFASENNSRFEQQKQQNKKEDFWDSGPNKSSQISLDSVSTNTSRFNQNRNQNPFKIQNNDTQSVTSDGSTKKKSFMKNIESVDEIAKVQLNVDEHYNVRVTYVETGKENICWVQELESSKNVDDMLLDLYEAAPGIAPINNPIVGLLGLAEFEDTWNRCRITNKDPLEVLFIDYGNREKVQLVKELPETFRKIPALANRIRISKYSKQLSDDMDLRIIIKQKYDDDTYLVELSNSSSEEKRYQPAEIPKELNSRPLQDKSTVPEQETEAKPLITKPEIKKTEEAFFQIPKPISELKNGDKVMLLNLLQNKFAVRTKDGAAKNKQILEYIKGLEKSNLIMSDVKEGQLVLCAMDRTPNLVRGVLLSKTSPTIGVVKYLDYSGENTLSLKSLRNVDKWLSEQPVTIHFTPEFECLNHLENDSKEYITELLEKKTKLNVVITEDDDFDLQVEDGLLQQKIFDLNKASKALKLTPCQKTKTESPPISSKQTSSKEVLGADESLVRITYNDMPFTTAEVGSTDDYICYTIKSMSEITLNPTNAESVAHLLTLSELDIKDETPFEPEVLEMCVVNYTPTEDSEPYWCRAVVLDKGTHGFDLSLVDYGTAYTVTNSKNIRRFPANLKEIPILGILCAITNIPDTEKIVKRAQEILPEGTETKVIFKEFNEEDDFKYIIEIPELTEKLKYEGLI